jgi:hypothetical protein
MYIHIYISMYILYKCNLYYSVNVGRDWRDDYRSMIMHYISRSFIFPIVMSILDWVCLFIREIIQRVDFVTQML